MRNKTMKIKSQAGFLSLPNDNIVKVLGVALSLCLVCSIIVSVAATALKPKQVANKELDKKSNIVSVAGLDDASKSVDERFSSIEVRVIDFESGDYTDEVDVNKFDQLKASKDAGMNVRLSGEQDVAKIGTRSKYGNVYLLKEGEQIQKIILPVRGYGLWSTMYGFVALESDAQTVSGITFYDHGETPGLGGEIENPKWQSSWQGKSIFDDQGRPALSVIKGSVNPNSQNASYQIDGLAGATLTSNGVTNLIEFWMGENGYGPYLSKYRNRQVSAAGPNDTAAPTEKRG